MSNIIKPGRIQRKYYKLMKEYIRGIPAFSVIIILVFIFIGVFGTFITPHDPNEVHFESALTPPSFCKSGSTKYLLGTDQLGRDVLSRLIVGARISLEVGFTVVILAGFIGSVVALLSGYLGGWIDTILMRTTDVLLSMPYLMIAIVIAAVLEPSKYNIILILTIMGWARYARVLRGEVLRYKDRDFVALAVVAGCSKTRIMFRHIYPNIVNTLIVLATLQIGIVIITESSLSYLGVGVPPPDPSWGMMVAEGKNYISNAWWLTTWPGICILLVVLSCNMVGDWLRVRLDPKYRQL